MEWDNDLLEGISKVSGLSSTYLKYAVTRLMRELYYGEQEILTRDMYSKCKPRLLRSFDGKPTPTFQQVYDVVMVRCKR